MSKLKEEQLWEQQQEHDSQQAALVQAMMNSQQTAEHKVKCMEFHREVVELRGSHSNDAKFGEKVAQLLTQFK